MNRSDRQINHPGRKSILQCIDYLCTAATPPSEGGENITMGDGLNKNNYNNKNQCHEN
jgi:hypothetical protein